MVTFVYNGGDDDKAAGEANTDDGDTYIAIALAHCFRVGACGSPEVNFTVSSAAYDTVPMSRLTFLSNTIKTTVR